jgi:aspartyl/asparaginyl-tRNA synthetase
LSLYADLLAPEGYGEVASSSQLIKDEKLLLRRLKEAGIGFKDQKWFRSILQSSSDPYSGFAIRIERVLQFLPCYFANLNNACFW